MEEFVFGNEEKLPTLTRMQEHFTGCRVLASCLMSNQVHLLLEPPCQQSLQAWCQTLCHLTGPMPLRFIRRST